MSNERVIDNHTRWLLQWSHDFYDHFMRGKLYNDTDERRRIRSKFPIPLWTRRRRDPATIQKQRLAWPAVTPRRLRYAFHVNKRSDDGAGKTVGHNLKLTLARLGVIVGRVLGAGSQGLVFQITYGGRNMVAKTSSSLQPMTMEMWAMRQLWGARHIVQRTFFGNVGADFHVPIELMNGMLSGGLNYTTQLAQWLRADPDQITMMYTMEFMKHGNFHGLLSKISEQQSWVRSAELWRIFYCLFRACVAMAYPGRWDRGTDPSLGTATVAPQEELVPLQNISRRGGIIDFDINDRNVMIGDYDFDDSGGQHSHDQVPSFKIGDLGIIRSFRPHPFHSQEGSGVKMAEKVEARMIGNYWCYTPEQFTQSWKNYAFIEDLNEDETAGKYDWWTNLWQVVQLMHIMITTAQPDIPPDCVQVGIVKPNGVTEQVFTYGSRLLEDKYCGAYDRDLRNILAWCMAHRPGDRPNMVELANILSDAIERTAGEFNEPVEHFRTTIPQLLNSPPPERPSGTGPRLELDR